MTDLVQFDFKSVIEEILEEPPKDWSLSRKFFHDFYNKNIRKDQNGWNKQNVEKVLTALKKFKKPSGVHLTESFLNKISGDINSTNIIKKLIEVVKVCDVNAYQQDYALPVVAKTGVRQDVFYKNILNWKLEERRGSPIEDIIKSENLNLSFKNIFLFLYEPKKYIAISSPWHRASIIKKFIDDDHSLTIKDGYQKTCLESNEKIINYFRNQLKQTPELLDKLESASLNEHFFSRVISMAIYHDKVRPLWDVKEGYLILTFKEGSPWDDELGKSYHYGATVPNYKKLKTGNNFLLLQKNEGFIAHGIIGDIVTESSDKDSPKTFRANYKTCDKIDPPKELSYEIKQKLTSLKSYNVQHSIKIINKDIFDMVLEKDSDEISYWQIAPARGARLWDEFRNQNIAAVGYSELNFDLSHKTKEELLDLYKKYCPDETPKQIEIGLRMLWYFRNLKPGDKFVTNKGRSLFLGLGIVKSGYKFIPDRKEYKHTVDVDYYNVSNEGIPIPDKIKGKFGKTIAHLKKDEFETIERLFPPPDSIKDKPITPIKTWKETKNSLILNKIGRDFELDNLYFENVDQIKNQVRIALQNNKHIILIGPPGTGKSKIAVAICEFYCGLNNYIMSTATSDWSTFETIGGYRPDKEGSLIFYPGIFLQCFQGKENEPINKWLIIDEINRADIDKAFGSFFSALTGDDITLPFDISGEQLKLIGDPKDETLITENQFIIHPHWRIIATMNTFDKTSLYEMSYAFMRRFAFIPIDVPNNINSNLIKKYLDIWEIEIDDSICENLSSLWELINSKRKIGPAIIKDLYSYIRGLDPHDYVGGLIMFVLPQFEGLLEDTQIEFIKEVALLDFINKPKELKYFASDFFGLDIKKFD